MPAVMEAPRKTTLDKEATFDKEYFKNTILRDATDSGIVNIVTDDDEYVLMSRKEYTDQINEALLVGMADERLNHFDPSQLISAEELYRELGITQEEIDAMPEVELE